jgi:probable F420-dependent oxidoreductase
MKIRIGLGLGVRSALNDHSFLDVVDAMEDLRFDSVWFTERIGGASPDPIVAMAAAAARTKKLKVGTSVMVLPGRNPIVLAKELATIDRISQGRLLPAFGLGAVDPQEQQAFGVERSSRGTIFNEALSVIRSCWMDERVTFHGEHFHYDNVKVEPKPIQQPPEVWLGGIAKSEIRRVGRLAEGWLPSFVTPDDAAHGWAEVNAVAKEHEREMDTEHFGVLIPYSLTPIPEAFAQSLAARRPDLSDPTCLVPQGWDQLVSLINEFISVGASKFVILPVNEPTSPDNWIALLQECAEVVIPLQT